MLRKGVQKEFVFFSIIVTPILTHSNGSITCISFTNNVNALVHQRKKECSKTFGFSSCQIDSEKQICVQKSFDVLFLEAL